MSKSNKVKIASMVLLLLVVITCSILFTNAKYTSSVNGAVSASVAKWVFNVTGNDSYSSEDTISNIKLAQTCDVKTLTNGKIAPRYRR